MQVKQEPSSGWTSVLVRYSTLPDLMATRHDPQLPARQPASMRMPCASASSRTESPGCQSQGIRIDERAGAAEIKLVIVGRQKFLEQLDADAAFVLMIVIFRPWPA